MLPRFLIDHLSSLSYQSHLKASLDQRNRQSKGIGASRANHVALTPHFELKTSVQLDLRIEMFHHHKYAGWPASEFCCLRIVGNIEHHLSTRLDLRESSMCAHGRVLCLTLEVFPALHRDNHFILSLHHSDSSKFTCNNANPFQFSFRDSLCTFELARLNCDH